MAEHQDKDAAPFIERIKGKAKELAGHVTGNKDLAREGELHQAKAEQLEDVKRQEAEAEQRKEEADLNRRARELELEEKRLVADEAAARQAADAERKLDQAATLDDTARS